MVQLQTPLRMQVHAVRWSEYLTQHDHVEMRLPAGTATAAYEASEHSCRSMCELLQEQAASWDLHSTPRDAGCLHSPGIILHLNHSDLSCLCTTAPGPAGGEGARSQGEGAGDGTAEGQAGACS